MLRLFRPFLLNLRDGTEPACTEDWRFGSDPVVESCLSSRPDRFLNRQKGIVVGVDSLAGRSG